MRFRRHNRHARRGTILLMVVTLLALLFVIVTGFLSVARNDRGTVIQVLDGDVAGTIVRDTTDLAVGLIGRQLVDSAGNVLGGGAAGSYSYEDIPGYRFSNYLASTEPVWRKSGFDTQTSDYVAWAMNGDSWSIIDTLQWPAVTSLDGGVTTPQAFRLWELLWDYDRDAVSLETDLDVAWNAREAFADADGDGMPDSHYLLGALATELANAKTGRYVDLPDYSTFGTTGGFQIYEVPDTGDDTTYFRGEIQVQLQENTRYNVFTRVISHGGMVTLSSPTLYDPDFPGVGIEPFNRDFVIDMFDAVRGDDDLTAMGGTSGAYPQGDAQNLFFDELAASTSAVESSLRRRFLLPSPEQWGDGNEKVRAVSAVLADLQEQFPDTFLHTFTAQSAGGDQLGTSYERINLGDADQTKRSERWGWAKAISYDPVSYNTPGPSQPNEKYDRRHILTTVNYSDELARKQDKDEPKPTAAKPFDFGMYVGERKYYLGEIAKAFVEMDVNGDPVSPAARTGVYRYDPVRGKVIIEQLARRYYDMLASHSGSDDEWGDIGKDPNSAQQAASRRQQAFMLAVNTVSFAMPRDTADASRGFIDVVSYSDLAELGNPLEYVGYAPQPFFTETIAYRLSEGDPNEDDPNKENISVGVELFNPHTPYYDAASLDVFALRMDQFAISVDAHYPGADPAKSKTLDQLFGVLQPFRGRTFRAFEIQQDEGKHFEAADPNIPTASMTFSSTGSCTLDLWRKGRRDLDGSPPVDDVWYHIDQIEIWSTPPAADEWKSRARDASPSWYLGSDVDGDTVVDAPARWNMVTGKEVEWGGLSSSPTTDTLGNRKWLQDDPDNPGVTRIVDPDQAPGAGTTWVPPFAPTVPLITMNAGPGEVAGAVTSLAERLTNLPLFRDPTASINPRACMDLRPRSFPTVGFMLFVPRFSHVREFDETMTTTKRMPVSDALRQQWKGQPYLAGASPLYPADFGHMPVFENRQDTESGTYLNEVGAIPWGLLVFDYFTTLNPYQDRNADGEPDVDSLKIPGRININSAPWFVLADVPMLGVADGSNPTPDPTSETSQLPIRWSDYGMQPAVSSAAGYLNGPVAPSPEFWDPYAGMLVGVATDPWTTGTTFRMLSSDVRYHGGIYGNLGLNVPYPADVSGRYRLGPWLAQAAAAYRDGVQYVPTTTSLTYYVYGYADRRNGVASTPYYPYRDSRTDDGTLLSYGTIRGAATTAAQPPTEAGFVSVGELLNVMGFDSSTHVQLQTQSGYNLAVADTTLARGDYIKAVSVLALLDSQYLTTRSNTFTVYTSVIDREEPQRSVHSQTTIDRSNMLPRLSYAYYYPNDGTGVYYYPVSQYLGQSVGNPIVLAETLPVVPLLRDLTGDNIPETPVRMTNPNATPRVIAHEQVGYFSAQHDN